MDKEQRAALRKLAEEATPGPWMLDTVTTSCGICHKIGPFPPNRKGGKDRHACLYADYASDSNPADQELLANARHIAAANPSTILQLLDYIETLEKDAGRYQWLSAYLVSEDTTHDDEIVACISTDELSYVVDNAMQWKK